MLALAGEQRLHRAPVVEEVQDVAGNWFGAYADAGSVVRKYEAAMT